MVVEHQARPGSCRAPSAAGGCGTGRRRRRPDRRSPPPSGPPAPRRRSRARPAPAAACRRSRSASRAARPSARASRWWACRWRASPCTGTAILGLIQRYICSSSSRQGWPETWTKWSPSVITSMPWRDQLVVQVVEGALVAGDDLGAEDHRVAGLEPAPAGAGRRRSAPGRCAAHPGCRCRDKAPGCAAAVRPRARRGSAACSAGSPPRAPRRASGASSGRPRTARGRQPAAASMAVSMRATLEAKLVRRDPVGLAARSTRSGCRAPRPRSPRSPAKHVGAVAQHRQHAFLARASRARRHRSGTHQRRRVELPVARVQQLPNAVSITSALASGIEWVTWTKRQRSGPSSNSWPGSTTRIGTSRAKSVSRQLARAARRR